MNPDRNSVIVNICFGFTDCAVGRYGNKCTSKCGNCADKTPCDVITGSCGPVGCADGFQGPTCHERVPVATSTALSPGVYAAIGVICVILWTILVFLTYHFCKKRCQTTPRSPNEEIELDHNYSNTDLIPTSSTLDSTLTTGNQNISTNTRNVDYVNQLFNTEDDTIRMIHYNTPDDTNNSIHL
ncbi:hypothetical protein SNE40_012414 [Patella caerulea]|uniref:EGF-like domain-containing protein n=1 Tax=Patella caerulea TaxID=87958 RepID=A0AAN8PMH4_PATCE